MKYAELDEAAKERAREKYRNSDHLEYEWWDSVYDDAVRMGEMLGIDIEHKAHSTRGGKTVLEPQIHFSGFSSQGDGACYSGEYSYEPEALQKLKAECNDEGLFRIAEELTVLQVTCRLKGIELDLTSISTSGRATHSHTMSVMLRTCDESDEPIDDIERAMLKLMRDFADWIYRQLEAEYDYLNSDEYIDERLADEEFDEGEEIV